MRSLGHTLASMQKFEDVTPDEASKSRRSSPGSQKTNSNPRRQTPTGNDEEIEEIGGATGGVGTSGFGVGVGAEAASSSSSDALWLNFDADEVEEQFLISADLEKTKKERKPRKDPP